MRVKIRKNLKTASLNLKFNVSYIKKGGNTNLLDTVGVIEFIPVHSKTKRTSYSRISP